MPRCPHLAERRLGSKRCFFVFTVWGLFPAPFLLTATVPVSILGPFFVPKLGPGGAPENVCFTLFVCVKKTACGHILARSDRLGRSKTASAASPQGRLGMGLRFLLLILTSLIHNRTWISVSTCKHNLDGHCDEAAGPRAESMLIKSHPVFSSVCVANALTIINHTPMHCYLEAILTST